MSTDKKSLLMPKVLLEVIIHNSKKGRKCNDQRKKDKMINSGL